MYVLVTQLMLAPFLHAETPDQRRRKVLDINAEEIRELTQLIKQMQDKAPDIRLRRASLYLERARLFRESEHEKFLAVKFSERRKLDQKSFYKQSSKLFDEAFQETQFISKKFPAYKKIPEVLYILSYIKRETGDYKASQKLLAELTKKTKSGSEIFYKSKLALANSYYSEGNYKLAIPLFEDSLGRVQQMWWTKDAYHLSWSYYREGQPYKGLELMKQAFEKSKSPNFIDVSDLIQRDILLFFVSSQKTAEGIQWYKSRKLDLVANLLRASEFYVSQQKQTQAKELLKYIDDFGQMTSEQRVNLALLSLELDEKFNNLERQKKNSLVLKDFYLKGDLDGDQKIEFENFITRKAVSLQKSVTSGAYDKAPKVKQSFAENACYYFDIRKDLQSKFLAESVFYCAEALYSADLFAKSFPYYEMSFLSQADKRLKRASMDGMLAVLGQKNFIGREKFYQLTYERFLDYYPDDEKESLIAQKLFKIYVDKKMTPEAHKIFVRYVQKKPRDTTVIEGMLLDLVKEEKKKNPEKIKYYLSFVEDNKIQVSSKFKTAFRNLVTNVQMADAQKSLSAGNRSQALERFVKIFEDPQTTVEAKSNATYNLSALYYESGDLDLSYQWAYKSLNLISPKDLTKFGGSFATIAHHLFLRRMFKESHALSDKILEKACVLNLQDKSLVYKNAILISLAEGDLVAAERVVKKYISCNLDPKIILEMKSELALYYIEEKRWESLEIILLDIQKFSQGDPILIKISGTLRERALAEGNKEMAQKMTSLINSTYAAAQRSQKSLSSDLLEIVSAPSLEQIRLRAQFIRQKNLKFPENAFNNALKEKMKALDLIQQDIRKVQAIGAGRSIVEAYWWYIESSSLLAKDLLDFTPPQKSADFIKSFKLAMQSLSQPLNKNAKDRSMEILQASKQNKILSPFTSKILSLQSEKPLFFTGSIQPVFMDRGGLR